MILRTIIATAELISPFVKLRFNPVAYGFPIDDEVLRQKAMEIETSDRPEEDHSEDGSEDDFDDDFEDDLDEPLDLMTVMINLERVCNEILRPCHHAEVVSGFADEGLGDDCDEDRNGHVHFLALFRCTRRDDKFLPPPEILQKLRDIMAKEGFTAKPYWFTMLA